MDTYLSPSAHNTPLVIVSENSGLWNMGFNIIQGQM